MRSINQSTLRPISEIFNTPEKSFLFAIIENAVNDYLLPRRSADQSPLTQKDAKFWLFGKQKTPYSPFSLGWVLEGLNCQKSLSQVQRDIKKIVQV
jgi:hypothetical protein